MLLGCGSVVFCFCMLGCQFVLLYCGCCDGPFFSFFSSFIFVLKVFWNFLNASDCIFVSVEIEILFSIMSFQNSFLVPARLIYILVFSPLQLHQSSRFLFSPKLYLVGVFLVGLQCLCNCLDSVSIRHSFFSSIFVDF